MARAWLIDATAAGIRRLFLLIGLFGQPGLKFATGIAFPRAAEIMAAENGPRGSQAMVTIEKVNLNWQIRPGHTPAQPLTALGDDNGA
jgi:hypothetical protein